jgi:putative copper resistance protein D
MGDLPIIAIRFALYADLMVLMGMTAFSLYALNAKERASEMLPLAWPGALLSLGGFLLSGFGMLALVASMMGTPVLEVDRDAFRGIVGETVIGTAWIVRMIAMAVAVASALMLGRWPTVARIGILTSAGLALATLVWTGHAGATEGWAGTVHRASDIVHMLAASVWIGGIAAFGWQLFRPLAQQTDAQLSISHSALQQFSQIGTIAVGLIVITGILNSAIILGLPTPALAGSLYVRMLFAKLVLFGGMLLLAAANRWRLTPALSTGIDAGDPAAAVRALRTSLVLENSAALAILALVAWLGTLEPLGMAS